jgi:hypothetical protein
MEPALPQGKQLNEAKFASKNVVYIFSKNFGSIINQPIVD